MVFGERGCIFYQKYILFLARFKRNLDENREERGGGNPYNRGRVKEKERNGEKREEKEGGRRRRIGYRMEKEKITGLRVLIYGVGIVIVSLGIVLCKKSNLGISPVSSIPFVLEEITGLSFGQMTMMFHLANSFMQLVLVKKWWDLKIYLQVPLAFVFGVVIDALQKWIVIDADRLPEQIAALLFSVVFTAVGMVCMIEMNLVQNPPDGTVRGLSQRFGGELGRVKIGYDISCVAVSMVLGLLCLQKIRGFGAATLVSAVMVGKTVSWIREAMEKIKVRKIKTRKV